jgi:predicted CXXCH cytochrome family protein
MSGDKVARELVSDEKELCGVCHSDVGHEKGRKFVHTPVRTGECALCHSPHASGNARLLLKSTDRLCADCHDLGLAKKKAVHTPVKNGECMRCHAPHSAVEKNNLSKAGNALCLSCHDDIAGLLKQKTVHAVAKQGCDTCHRPHATDNVAQLVAEPKALCAKCHDPRSPRIRNAHQGFSLAKIACNSCHDPHGSPEKALVRARPHKVFRSCDKCHKSGGPTPGALQAASPQLCFRCHSEKKIALQKPGAHEGAKGDCLACHTPHAANEPGLVAGSERAACLGCHDKIERVIATSRSIHPLRAERGRCSICHEPHQTTNRMLLARDDETLCRKCHTKHAQFGHPVGPNVRDPRNGQAITCLSCHTPHGSQWSYILIDNPSQALCVRCHDPTGTKGGKRIAPKIKATPVKDR